MKKITTGELINKSASPCFRVARGLSGLGLVATRDITRGQTIVEYVGPLLSRTEADDKGGRYLFDVNSRWTVDGSGRTNVARYANHSCQPNAEAAIKNRRIFITALKPIKPGEEICYDYGKEYFDEFIKPHGCRCASCQKKSPKRV